MGHCSVVPCEFGLVKRHWVVTVNVVHVFHHDLREFQWDWSCVGGPVEPSYLSWIPESCFWTTSSGFEKCNRSISVCIAPFEVWKVVVTNYSCVKVFVTINFWYSLKYLLILVILVNRILPLRKHLEDCHKSNLRIGVPWRRQVLKVRKFSFLSSFWIAFLFPSLGCGFEVRRRFLL